MAFFRPTILVDLKEDILSNQILVKLIGLFVCFLSSTVKCAFRGGRDWNMPG